jgi:carboxypeptidase D
MARLNSRHNQSAPAASWLTRLLPWAVTALLALSSPATAEKTAADYYVDSLPGQPDGPLLKMHAGYVIAIH